MDFSEFSDEDFDPDEWVKKLCNSEEAHDNTEEFLGSVLSKLQLHIQHVNANLEEENESIMSSMPKVLRDTLILQQEAESLKDKMKFIEQELENVETGSGGSIYVLEELDKMKEELLNKQKSLKEADNWTTLANDVEDVFESGEIEKISAKLFSMQKSLSMLGDTFDYEDKKLQLEGLKNRLEAMTSPKLVQAFTAGSVEQSILYVDVFSKMDRLPQLLKYYHNCLKISLAQDWRKTIEFAQEENVVYWLKMYFEKLLSVWQVQVKWFKHVFDITSIDILVEVYADLFRSLDPGILECIEAALKQQNSCTKILILIEIKNMIKQFAGNLRNFINVDCKDISNEKVLALAKAMYMPLVPYISKYGIYETSNLNQFLNSIEVSNEDLSDSITHLSLSVAKIINYANEANERCKEFSEGCAYPGFISTINTFFPNYLEKYRNGMNLLNKRKVKREDWNLFQMCLTLMQTVGQFLSQLEEFENKLVNDIVAVNNKLQNPGDSTFTDYKILFLTPNSEKEFQDFVTSLQKETKSLLDPTKRLIQNICSDLHRSTYEVIFAPIFTQLRHVSKAPAWSSSAHKLNPISADLPDFSYSPQEYITQVGQYLMTLPQHLEPFLLRDNPSLTKALRSADSQYAQESCQSGFTNILLGIIAKETCQMFQDQTWGIYELNSIACKQLATDIDYLGNILDELGLCLSENLQQMTQLLRLSPDEYQTGSAGCNPRVVAAVRQMRNIKSAG